MNKQLGTIRCQLVAGPLGVGKTTTILNVLARFGDRLKIGVLVNDFGPMGLDESAYEDSDAVQAGGMPIVTLPGGCVCCEAADNLVAGLGRLREVAGLELILIEPSGVATPEQVVDVLREYARYYPVRVLPTVVVMNAGELDVDGAFVNPYHLSMVDSADILVLNRCDTISEQKLTRFRAWADQLDPPKLSVHTVRHGLIPDSVLEPFLFGELPASPSGTDGIALPMGRPSISLPQALGKPQADDTDRSDERAGTLPGVSGLGGGQSAAPVDEEGPASATHDHGGQASDQGHRHPHASDKGRAGGWTWSPDRLFDPDQLMVNGIRLCLEGVDAVPIARLKGVFRTEEGWYRMDIACGQVDMRPSRHRRDSRVEWISLTGVVDPEKVRKVVEEAML